MNIRHLRIFKEVCKTNSISEAAKNIYVSQPAVSLAIKELETDTGLVLFDRIANKLQITVSGKLYLEKVEQLLPLYDELEMNHDEISKAATLRIGSCITLACSQLPEIINAFKKQKTKFNLIVGSAEKMLELISHNEIDIALYEGREPSESFESIYFSSYKLLPICSNVHPFANQKDIELSNVLKENVLLREPGSAVRDAVDYFFGAHEITVTPFMSSTNSQAIIKAVEANVGISILPEPLIHQSSTISTFTIKDMHLTNSNWIVIHKDKYKTNDIKNFTNLVLNYKEKAT